MKRVGDSYQYDRPEQKAPYHWTTYIGVVILAAILALTLGGTLPWHPAITFGAVILLAIGERLILRPRR